MLGCGPLKNKIDFRLLMIRSTYRIPSDSQEKLHNHFIFLHLFKEIHLRKSCISESCKSEKCLEKAYLRVKVAKTNFEICKKDVL